MKEIYHALFQKPIMRACVFTVKIRHGETRKKSKQENIALQNPGENSIALKWKQNSANELFITFVKTIIATNFHSNNKRCAKFYSQFSRWNGLINTIASYFLPFL